ncbi:MAG TPA: LysR family substrate-binding domain-containing protein, partial [Nocardioides sp.]|nr:LysR family substrate-binding domain-containing protein [Nocardioides sp.]
AQLEDELRPAWEQVEGAWQRAVDAARGVSGSLRVGFVGPAAGQLLARATKIFGEVAPECEVTLVELPTFEVAPLLHAGETDLALSVSSAHEPDIRRGPVLVREAWILAVPVAHPFARRKAVEPGELERVTMLEVEGLPRVDRPERDPAPPGSVRGAATLTEGLTLVGSGLGALAVGASVSRYHPRPDVAYVPLTGGPSLEWRLAWVAERTTARLRAFVGAAQQAVS